MGVSRRPNGSIVGASVIPTTTYPSNVYGLWDKNEQASLVSANLWTGYGGLSLSYNFTSNTSVTLLGVNIIGNNGTTGGAGGSYSITNNTNGYNSGGVAGGQTAGTRPLAGGAGGSIGGVNSINDYTTGTPADISGLDAVITALGYSATNFGRGGNGAYGGSSQPGQFAGGGGGGGNNGIGNGLTYAASGGNGAIVIQYISAGVTNNQIINQSSGSGSIILAGGTIYIKIWAIGRGGDGVAYGGAGGGAGGVAWCEFK